MAVDYYCVGNDKTLVNVAELALLKAGGSLYGDIGFNNPGVRDKKIIRFIKGDANGSGISIGDGGIVVIGSGESATLLQPAEGGGASERMIIAGDTTIEFYVNCQDGAAGAVKVEMSRTGLLSGHQKAIRSGTAAPSGGSNGDIYIQY